jgi:hypothetical protein
MNTSTDKYALLVGDMNTGDVHIYSIPHLLDNVEDFIKKECKLDSDYCIWMVTPSINIQFHLT